MSSAMPSDPARRAEERRRVAAVIAVTIVALLWGGLWKRSAALTDVASVLPILLLIVGPGLLVAFVGSQVATGQFTTRGTGLFAALAVAGGLVGNLVTPGLPPSVDVSGHLTGTLDGQAVDAAATCTWGPGQTAVILVAAKLPAIAGSSMFSANIPSGTVDIELPSGTVTIVDIPPTAGFATMPLRNGSGGAGGGDESQGSLSLAAAQGATVDGQLSWACGPPPAP